MERTGSACLSYRAVDDAADASYNRLGRIDYSRISFALEGGMPSN